MVEQTGIIDVTPQIKVLKWVIYKVVAPLLVILIIWPVYGFSLGIKHSFEEAFSHGDLLIFSALILIEAFIEVEYNFVRDWRFHLGRDTALVLAVVALILFAVVKIDVMREASSPDYYKMLIYGRVGWCMAVLAGLLSIYDYWRACYNRADAKLNSFQQPAQ
jgi:hypothetical protein